MAGPVGSSIGVLTGVAVGGAATVALQPAFEVPKQDAWSRNPHRILDVGLLARLVAQGGVALGTPGDASGGTAYGEALRQGFGSDKLDRLIYLAQTAPDLALTLELWRRGLLGNPTGADAIGLVRHAFAKHQIEPQYWPALQELFSGRLDPALIATMVQRSVLANATDPVSGEHLLPNQPSSANSDVPPMPQVGIDPIVEARAHGIDFDRLAAEARIVGLPASPDLAARMHFRKLINLDAFNLAIKEGNTRGEWAPFLLDGFRQILTAGEYAELQLRGYYGRDERIKNTRKSGMSDDDSDLLYDVQGRGMSLHSAFIADRRGGVFKGPTDAIPDWALFQLQRGNLRPEVYNMEWAQRHTYPSPFVIRGLLTGGAIDPAKGEELYLHIGWPADLAHQVATFYGKATTTTGDSHTGKAQNQLWTATHKSYIAQEIGDATATTALSAAGVTAAAVPAILALWKEERSLIRKQLSPTQIRKALNLGVVNPATGVPWTVADAHAALLERGYDSADATVFLEE